MSSGIHYNGMVSPFHEQIQCLFEDGNVCKQNTHTSHIYSVLPFREQIERVFLILYFVEVEYEHSVHFNGLIFS